MAVAARAVPAHAPRWRPSATLRSVGWLTIAQGAAGSSAFGVSMIRARSLSLEDFGAYALAAALVSLLSNLADGGLSTMMVRDLARGVPDVRRYLGAAFALTTSLALAAAVVVIACGAAFGDARVTLLCGVLGVTMVLVGAGAAPFAYLRSTGRAAYESAARIAAGAAIVTFSLLAAALGGGPEAFAWAMGGATAVGVAIAALVVVLAVGPIAPRVSLPEWRALAIDSAPLGAAMMLTAVYYYADSLLLGVFGEREALARYNAAYVFVFAAVTLIAAVRSGFTPALSRAYAGDGALRPVLGAYLRTSLFLALPLTILGPLLASHLLQTAYGDAYVPASGALRILFVTTGVMCVCSYFGACALVSGRQRAYLKATALGAALNVGLNVILIPRFGITGAASATLAAEAAVCAALVWFVRTDPHPSLAQLVGARASATPPEGEP